jgi:hypothetical protein
MSGLQLVRSPSDRWEAFTSEVQDESTLIIQLAEIHTEEGWGRGIGIEYIAPEK